LVVVAAGAGSCAIAPVANMIHAATVHFFITDSFMTASYSC
jgi:hypothetical protein